MPDDTPENKPQRKSFILLDIYDKKYKALLIFPMLLIVLSVAVLASHYFSTGELFERDVSLKGGATISINSEQLDAEQVQTFLAQRFAQGDISVRQLSSAGQNTGVIIDAGIPEEQLDELLALLEEYTSVPSSQYAVRFMGSTLGASFFRETMWALAAAFAMMGVAVFVYFRFFGGIKSGAFIPSLFVVWTVFNDIIGALAVMVLLDVKISTAGLAAFLMLIGYSVDTDILLTTRVLRSKEGTVFERIKGALRTGLIMTLTSFIAVFAGFLLSQSETIRQIMLVLSVGLLFDIVHTWITNAGVLRWYLEKRKA